MMRKALPKDRHAVKPLSWLGVGGQTASTEQIERSGYKKEVIANMCAFDYFVRTFIFNCQVYFKYWTGIN
ncbi:hypothetical protein DSCW_59320 [Desulfosarcina widdelii]|uniref:Uncharacterized protein n=1 Tax=Desulfosarcina widdelii TaxID=947919 RepID=A0A5K7ZCL0_9BACT|nr:hypothetical protein DSCW_59320 [Desulfosarcina widdelii]